METEEIPGQMTIDECIEFVTDANRYKVQTLITHVLPDGSERVWKNELETIEPPCQVGCGCRAVDFHQRSCGFDPKTGLCNGRMS